MTKKELMEIMKDMPEDAIIAVRDGYGEYYEEIEVYFKSHKTTDVKHICIEIKE
jgi:hypothetical protein